MQVTLEQVIAEARALHPAERAQLRRWLDEQAFQQEKARRQEQLDDDEMRFQLALEWLRENRAAFAGQWVALDGNRLLSHGPKGAQVHAEAKAAGVKSPLLERIPLEENDLPFGGW